MKLVFNYEWNTTERCLESTLSFTKDDGTQKVLWASYPDHLTKEDFLANFKRMIKALDEELAK